MEPDWVVRFYNQRGTAEQHQGRQICLSLDAACHAGSSGATRCGCNCTRWPTTWQPSCAASNCPKAMADWSLTSLQLKLIKIGARVVRHARAITFQLAEVAVTGPMVRAVLAAIRRLRTPPSCA
ncbi:MAG: transposase [Paracoccaceae bacterium]